MKNQIIQELSFNKATLLIFKSKLNILKDLLKNNKISKQQFIQKVKMLKNQYGLTIMSSMRDPTVAVSLDKYLSFIK